MRRFPTTKLPAFWSDPFRLVLTISLVALVGWVAVQSSAERETTSRSRTSDLDQGVSGSIVVTLDDSPFDLPFDELVVTPAAPTAATSTTSPVAPAPVRSTTGSRGTTRAPGTRGGSGTSPAPATGGGNQSGGAAGPGSAAPDDKPGNGVPGVPGVSGNSGTTGTPGVPGVELPLPALAGQAGSANVAKPDKLLG